MTTTQLLEWLRDDDAITFVSVRDPVERVKSAYNWRKHVCSVGCPADEGEEQLLFECFTTLNAFSEGTCDGLICGEGWDEKHELVLRLLALRGTAPSSCADVRGLVFERKKGGHIGMDVAWYFSDIKPELLRAIATNVHGGVLPGFRGLGRLNPLYVVRNSHISEDINVMMAHHEKQLDYLLTEVAHPGDRSDLSAARELARRRGIEGKRLPTTHSEYPQKSDSYVSPAGEARLREELRDDYELYDLLVGSQEQRALRPD